ncbi:hypothetical protein ACFXTN_025455 [Malus domestica]
MMGHLPVRLFLQHLLESQKAALGPLAVRAVLSPPRLAEAHRASVVLEPIMFSHHDVDLCFRFTVNYIMVRRLHVACRATFGA